MGKRVIGFFGIFLRLIGFSMLLPLVTALAYREYSSARAFVVAIVISLTPSILIVLSQKHSVNEAPLKMRDSYFIVAMAWIMASLLSAIPFLLVGSIANPIEAFFEMCSGYSTTGSTILTSVEELPRSLLLWRSETQWLGGMGIIVLVVAFLPDFGIKARTVASAETPGPTVTKLTSRFTGTAQRLYLLYLAFTLTLMTLLMFGGMSLYDALNHAFTTMATGGFSTYNDSIAHFHSPYITWVITVFMIIAGTNFNLFFDAAISGLRKMLADQELQLYLFLLGTVTALVTVNLLQHGEHGLFDTVTDAAFQVVTIITTTGFATADFDLWPAFSKMLLVLLMITGACSSSTAGGVKLVRVVTIFKMLRREVRMRLHDNIVDDVKLNHEKLGGETLTYIGSFVIVYISTLVVGIVLVSFGGSGDFVTDFTAVLTCISNVGPGLAKVGPTQNFHFYNDFAKFVLALIMVAGRLELTTFLILFSRHYWNPHKTYKH